LTLVEQMVAIAVVKENVKVVWVAWEVHQGKNGIELPWVIPLS